MKMYTLTYTYQIIEDSNRTLSHATSHLHSHCKEGALSEAEKFVNAILSPAYKLGDKIPHYIGEEIAYYFVLLDWSVWSSDVEETHSYKNA